MSEYQRKYREKHIQLKKKKIKVKKSIEEYRIEYYNKHKEKLDLYRKEYYKKKRENQKRVKCEVCNEEIFDSSLRAHKLTKKHNNNMQKNIIEI